MHSGRAAFCQSCTQPWAFNTFNRSHFLVNRPPQPPVVVQSNVRELRLAAGLSQQSAAERFDLSLRVWQTKEAAGNPALLSQGEYELLLLLAGRHPYFSLAPLNKKQG